MAAPEWCSAEEHLEQRERVLRGVWTLKQLLHSRAIPGSGTQAVYSAIIEGQYGLRHARAMRECRHSLAINAPPAAILDAFFDADALRAWWQVSRSVCTPRPLGSFALEWESTKARDELLGRLGGALHGTVMEFVPGRQFFVADLYWHPPEGDPIGPMALAAKCTREGDATLLQVCQSGYDKKSERWARYYDIMSNGWVLALGALKSYLEARRT